MNLIEKEQMIRISTGGSRKLVKNSKEIRRKNSRKSSGQSDIDDWRIVEHKEIVKSDTSLTMFINGCRNKWAKLAFILKCISSCPLNQLKFGPSGVKMLGKQYRCYEKFINDYCQLIYFSYRQSMKTPLMRTSDDAYTQDTNWGCSIRSSQMLFGQILQKLLMPNLKNMDFEEKKLVKRKILNQFLDKFSSPLSIHNICEQGRRYEACIGEYWRPLTAILCLGNLSCSEILDNYDNHVIFSKKINKENLKFGKNNSSSKQKLKELGVPEFTMVLCKNNMIDFENIKKTMKQDFMLDQSNGPLNMLEKPVLVILVAMFGNEKINYKNFKILGKLLTCKSSVGFIGGVQRQAYYIIGQYEQSLIILDPHDVNSSETSLMNLKSYQPHSDARLVKFTEFNSCLNLGFLIKSEEDFKELEQTFAVISNKMKDEFYISTTFHSKKLKNMFKEEYNKLNEEEEDQYAFFNDSDDNLIKSMEDIEEEESSGEKKGMDEITEFEMNNLKSSYDSLLDSFVDVGGMCRVDSKRKESDDITFEIVEETI